MAEDAKPWDAVYDQIKAYRDPIFVPLPPVTDADLDEAESQLGSSFPRSYRAFMTRFGPGQFELSLRLFPLKWGPLGCDSLLERTANRRAEFLKYEFPNAAWLGRVVYFGCNDGGDPYVWDPQEVSGSGCGEGAIYFLERHQEFEPRRVAKSFPECVQNAIAESHIWPETHLWGKGVPKNAFHQLHARLKDKPSPWDLRAWLAFNNNTARDLARAIRAEGRAEVFPILADALEEAGCTNADVLDSCRTGDPDIDGVWVLRVLLGEA